jgi:hypothetical protein
LIERKTIEHFKSMRLAVPADDLRADLDEVYQVSLTMTDRPSLGFRAACASALSTSDTIFAIASGAGRAALAVLRVSGPVTQQIVESVAGSLPEPCFAALKTFRDPATGAVGMICPS